VVLSRENTGDRVPAYFEHHGPKAVLIVDPDGADAGRAKAVQRKLAGQGQTLLSVDAFQTGSAVAPRDRLHQHFLAFNLSDDSNRVQDVLTALGFLAEQGCTSVDLYGEGKAAWWVEFAAAVAPRDVQIRLHIPDQSLVDSEAAFLTNFDVPGILHAGGLRTADRLIKGRR
jgi:hypothetical protein